MFAGRFVRPRRRIRARGATLTSWEKNRRLTWARMDGAWRSLVRHSARELGR